MWPAWRGPARQAAVITQIVTLRFSELRESILNSAYKFTKHSADATLLLMGIIIRQAFSGKGIFLSDAGIGGSILQKKGEACRYDREKALYLFSSAKWFSIGFR
jgi:hypothetical protein